ncbi:hypothetical protein VTJ83DRAFT_6049 [Remersonia thermophila]|uniref:NodB homology domain-containing protein n=1 Tax=Remersonia thermophila TaxID=72144 RepID=A0ABR4D8V9_9PEZI
MSRSQTPLGHPNSGSPKTLRYGPNPCHIFPSPERTTPPPTPAMPAPSSSRWPTPHRAAIALTMDNLGEAQDVLRGSWPHPIGTHPSIANQLPRMLDLLARHRLRATYFVEAWSLGVYPEVVARLLREGHEVAWHGFQHEVWSGLSEEEERRNFEKSWRALEEARLAAGAKEEVAETVWLETYNGFRPPGGKVNEGTWELLREHGVDYVSPLGEFGMGKGGVVVLPFEWRSVDAFWYMEKFAGIRREHGEREEAHSPEEFRGWLMRKIDEVVEEGGFMSILFHPFLTTSEERFAVMEDVVKRLKEDERIWVAPCREIAGWVKRHPEHFAQTPLA